MDPSIPRDLPVAPADDASLADLAERIVREHHEPCRRGLARLGERIAAAARAYGPPAPSRELPFLWGRFSRDLAVHLQKEEQTLFPLIVELEQACGRGSPPPRLSFGRIEHLVRMMRLEHGEEGALLARLGELLPAPDGAPERVALERELAAFDLDLRRHVELEDDVLFARTIALERNALGPP